jgi:predicted RND superfamily exporter protein
MLEKILHYQIKYSKILLFFMLLLIGFSAYTATGIKINPDLGALVDKDSEYNTNDRIMSNAFGVNDALLVLVSVDKESKISNGVRDMNSDSVISYVEVLKETLAQSPYYVSITPNQISDSSEMLYFAISLNSPTEIGSFQTVLSELEYLVSEAGAPPGVDVKITGMPVMMDRIAGYLIGDSLNTVLITIIFIVVILYLYSRDLVFTLITVATPVSSLILLGAFMTILGINITITLAAVGVLVLGLGADYGIHIATHYSAARKEHDNHEAALINTIKDLALPITASFVTTLAGFVALTLGVSPSSQSQGIVLSLAIAIIYATSFALFPVLITVFANHVTFKPNVVFDKIMLGLGKFAVWQTLYAKKILWGLGFLTIIMMYNASNVEFSNSNSNWIPTDDEVSNSFSEINFAYGQSETITYILTSTSGDLRDANVKRDVDKLVAAVRGVPYVDLVINPFEGLDYDSNEIYDSVTGTHVGMTYFNRDYTMMRIVVNSQNPIQDADGKSLWLAELKRIGNLYPVYNTEISYFGDAVRFDELTDSLQKDASVTTLTGFALVFLVASFIYASLSVGFLALFPILIAVIWTVGLMSIFSVPFTTLSTGIVSLVLGVGVDFSIHLVDGIKKYLAKGHRISESIQYTFSTSGKAIILASITTMVGFSALLLAKLLGTQRMGMSLSLSILAVFIVTFTMVPAIMTLLNKDTNKNKSKNLNLKNSKKLNVDFKNSNSSKKLNKKSTNKVHVSIKNDE